MISFDVFLFKNVISFQVQSFYDVTQYDFIIGSLQRPCNFEVSQCIKSKFNDLGYFDLFSSKMLFVFKFKTCLTS